MKPWYRKWSIVGALIAALAYLVADYSGLDMGAVAQKILDAAVFAGWLVALVGAIASDVPVDPEQVLPKVRSKTVGNVVRAVQTAKKKLAP
jgi:anti-sigma factor RsiW